ncbi:hypothetical protein D6D10_03819 [Aureobasidium pullulans]|uniref:Uncharacterized protein n=1 Tax=Aureobasidium pullulans TaxID=5580 RepID=A0A4S9EYP1_AURPU|nr:hypothetical protein D6D10_03819 [Aureobasidium pullulans]
MNESHWVQQVLQQSEGSVLIVFVQVADHAGPIYSKSKNAEWTVEHLGEEALKQCTIMKWTCGDFGPPGGFESHLEKYGEQLLEASRHATSVSKSNSLIIMVMTLMPAKLSLKQIVFVGDGLGSLVVLQALSSIASHPQSKGNVATCFFGAILAGIPLKDDTGPATREWLFRQPRDHREMLHPTLNSLFEKTAKFRTLLSVSADFGEQFIEHSDGSINRKEWDTLAELIDVCSSIECDLWRDANMYHDANTPQRVDFGSTRIALFSWESPEALVDWDLSRETSDYLDTISISGRDSRFEALSCKTYLRKYWGNLGVRIASLLLTAAAQVYENKGETITPPVYDKHQLFLYAFPTHVLLLSNRANIHLYSQSCEIVQWFCQTFRSLKQDEKGVDQGLQISRSFALHHHLYKEYGSENSCFLLQPVMPFKPSRADCWTSLFKHGIVAEISDDRFVPPDDFEGIEIDFQLMVSLAAVTSYYWLETDHTAGFILLGFFTALVPVSMHTSGAIEWHFESRYPKVLDSMQPDHQTAPSEDPAGLHAKRCFVGLWPQAEVLLGSEGAEYDMGESNLPCLSKALHFEGAELAGALGGAAGPVQPIFQGTAVYKLRSHVQQFEKATCYAAALNILTRQVALVYDRQSDIGWLVPQLSLLLHLCHVYYAMHHGTSGQPDPIPWALPSSDGASAALEAFSGSNEVVITSHGPHNKVLLENVLLTLNANFMQTHRTKRSPTPTIVGSKKLYFSELMDQVTQPPGGSPLRVLKTSKLPATKAWLDIINHVDALFVCKNIGQAIGFAGVLCPSNNTSNPNGPSQTPTPVTGCQCSEIPHGQGYLVAHNKCLQRVLSRSPLACNLAGQPFDPQNKHSLWTCPVQVLQNLEKLDSHKERVANPPPGGPPEGAIVFGRLKGSWF